MRTVALFGLMICAGCATTPTPTTAIGTATQINTAALTAAIALAQAGTLSSAQLKDIVNITNAAEAALVTAEAAVNAGNATSASATLTAVTATLTALTTCLNDKTTSAITACVVGVPQP